MRQKANRLQKNLSGSGSRGGQSNVIAIAEVSRALRGWRKARLAPRGRGRFGAPSRGVESI